MNKIFEKYFKGKRFKLQAYRESRTLTTYVIWDMNSRSWDSLLGNAFNEPVVVYQGILGRSNDPLAEYESEFIGAIVEYLENERNQAREILEKDILKDYQKQLNSLRREKITVNS